MAVTDYSLIIPQGDDYHIVFTLKTNAQSITLPAGVDGGTFQLEFQGQITEDIEWDASADDLKLALEKLTTIGAGNVLVTKDDVTWSVVFIDELYSIFQPDFLYDSLLTPTTVGAIKIRTIPYDLTGYSGRMQIRPSLDSPTPIIALTTGVDGGMVLGDTAGTVTLDIPREKTKDFQFTGAVWDAVIRNAAGKDIRILQGPANVNFLVSRV